MIRLDASDPAFLEGLFDGVVHAAASPLRDGISRLSSAERALVVGVVRQREREFVTGRLLARQLLRQQGHRDFALLRDADRVPIWPEGVVGSIAHKDDLCVVAIAAAHDRVGLGVDVELDQPVKPGLERLVCRPRERDWVTSVPSFEGGRRCRALFSAKEAVYKAFFPRIREVWGFQDVEVEIDFGANAFRAEFPQAKGSDRTEVEGRILRRGGWILSALECR